MASKIETKNKTETPVVDPIADVDPNASPPDGDDKPTGDDSESAPTPSEDGDGGSSADEDGESEGSEDSEPSGSSGGSADLPPSPTNLELRQRALQSQIDANNARNLALVSDMKTAMLDDVIVGVLNDLGHPIDVDGLAKIQHPLHIILDLSGDSPCYIMGNIPPTVATKTPSTNGGTKSASETIMGCGVHNATFTGHGREERWNHIGRIYDKSDPKMNVSTKVLTEKFVAHGCTPIVE